LIAGSTQKELARQIRYLKIENEILRSKLAKRVAVTEKERNRLVKFAAKLGIKAVSRNTVKNILKENGLDPGPERGAGTWDEFLKIHAARVHFSGESVTEEHRACQVAGLGQAVGQVRHRIHTAGTAKALRRFPTTFALQKRPASKSNPPRKAVTDSRVHENLKRRSQYDRKSTYHAT